ncbi:hypothetical protein [Desulfosporosinus sp. FKB]|uniref:hypothetical protein n=1 Tax=Desulfosporosinus sp. FKB TaxID=1969835 RepID=UPI000B49E5D5|nr:hypothetical protein [Desulfosporosinus sp. FKB]
MEKVVVIEKKGNEYLVEFNKTFNFEGRDYNEVDLSGLERLTTMDLARADKMFISTGQVAMMNEMSTGYVCIIASMVSNKPVEFFQALPAKEGIKIKTIISSFFYN